MSARPNVPQYPAATQTAATWAKKNKCTGALVEAKGRLDVNAAVSGEETRVARYDGCPAGGDVELWTIHGGAHVPKLERAWADAVWKFLAAHPKP